MAEVKRYAIVRDGIVENVTLWDGVTPWTPPSGTDAVLADDQAEIGATYDGKTFTRTQMVVQQDPLTAPPSQPLRLS